MSHVYTGGAICQSSVLSENWCTTITTNRDLVGPFKSRRRKQEDFALTDDLVTSVKGIAQSAGWLEELERMSDSDSEPSAGPSDSSHQSSNKTGHRTHQLSSTRDTASSSKPTEQL